MRVTAAARHICRPAKLIWCACVCHEYEKAPRQPDCTSREISGQALWWPSWTTEVRHACWTGSSARQQGVLTACLDCCIKAHQAGMLDWQQLTAMRSTICMPLGLLHQPRHIGKKALLTRGYTTYRKRSSLCGRAEMAASHTNTELRATASLWSNPSPAGWRQGGVLSGH